MLRSSPSGSVLVSRVTAQWLPAQLALLQQFLPLDGWLVLRVDAGQASTVCASGQARHVPLAVLEPHAAYAMAYSDLVAGALPLWRPLSGPQLPSEPADVPRWLIGFGLPVPCMAAHYVLCGLSYREAPPYIAHMLPEPLALCIKALGHALTTADRVSSMERALSNAMQDAYLDPLTRVLNRAGWEERLRRLPEGQEMAVVFVDVDFLKQVNDTQGHLAGDRLLQKTARTLQGLLRRDDYVARLGGDEFAVLLQGVSSSAADGIRSRLAQALEQCGIKASLGVAFKSEAASLAEAVTLADSRMYAEKRLKKAVPHTTLQRRLRLKKNRQQRPSRPGARRGPSGLGRHRQAMPRAQGSVRSSA